MIVMYGLKNCDTCRKGRKWLDGENIGHRFHDVRADGLDEDRVARWLAAVGGDRLINRRGTTWRQLGEAEKAIAGDDDAVALLVAHPAIVKRPVFETDDGQVLVGFGDAERSALAASV